MNKINLKLAQKNDANLIKEMINQMYGIEYERREIEQIAKAIKNKTEIYILAYINNKCIGFSGASLNNDYYADIITPDIAVIDYIYVDKNSLNNFIAFDLISTLLKRLVEMNVKSAIMQVQTSNKQKYFHYALSDKNIIKSNIIPEFKDKNYYDQILLIQNIEQVSQITLQELMQKTHKYVLEEKNS